MTSKGEKYYFKTEEMIEIPAIENIIKAEKNMICIYHNSRDHYKVSIMVFQIISYIFVLCACINWNLPVLHFESWDYTFNHANVSSIDTNAGALNHEYNFNWIEFQTEIELFSDLIMR